MCPYSKSTGGYNIKQVSVGAEGRCAGRVEESRGEGEERGGEGRRGRRGREEG